MHTVEGELTRGVGAGSAGKRCVALVSLEPWDDVWRRNQHLAHQLIALGEVTDLLFVDPPTANPLRSHQPESGITVVTPQLRFPPRYGGLYAVAAELRRRWLRDVDVLWVNNAPLGRLLLGPPAVYDVTDDWRTAEQGWASRRRLLRAESVLARRATTVVCSEVLRARWLERYGVDAVVVPNGVDTRALAQAVPTPLDGPRPHFGYVGTLQEERLDLDLVLQVAAGGGTVHLVGPDHLTEPGRQRLLAVNNIRVPGPVAADQVPGLLKAFDVLLLPHLVSPFTLSLDAIKSREYLATSKPVVATPTSGFQDLKADGVAVVGPDDFARAARAAVDVVSRPAVPVADWRDRARSFVEAWPAPAARLRT